MAINDSSLKEAISIKNAIKAPKDTFKLLTIFSAASTILNTVNLHESYYYVNWKHGTALLSLICLQHISGERTICGARGKKGFVGPCCRRFANFLNEKLRKLKNVPSGGPKPLIHLPPDYLAPATYS